MGDLSMLLMLAALVLLSSAAGGLLVYGRCGRELSYRQMDALTGLDRELDRTGPEARPKEWFEGAMWMYSMLNGDG